MKRGLIIIMSNENNRKRASKPEVPEVRRDMVAEEAESYSVPPVQNAQLEAETAPRCAQTALSKHVDERVMPGPAAEALEKYRIFKTRIFARDGRKCQICFTSSKLTAHHIKPRDLGGSDEPRNGITLCQTCHDMAEEWPWENFWPRMKAAQFDQAKLSKSDGKYRIWGRDHHGVFSIEVDDPPDDWAKARRFK